MKRKIIALLLAIAIILPGIPVIGVSAAEGETAESSANLTVAETWANPDGTVDVDLVLTENPGILGATFTVAWGEGMSLIGDTNGTAFAGYTYQKPSRYISSGTSFTWYGNSVENIANGTVLTLTFKISSELENNTLLPVNVTCIQGEVVDGNDNDVNVNVENGVVRVITYRPGDVTNDGKENIRDLVKLSQYISDGCTTDPEGYNAEVTADACDTNGDGKINVRDLIRLSQYISDGCTTDPEGYNAILYPAKLPECVHSFMEFTAAKAENCTEAGNTDYYYCSDCNKYYSDEKGVSEIDRESTVIEATGHSEVSIPETAPTYTEWGSTGGVKCSVCGTVLVEPTPIEPLTPTELYIEYDIYGTDTYLEGLVLDMLAESKTIHTNPSKFNTSTQGYTISDIPSNTFAGYKFAGWYDNAVGGNLVKKVALGESGSKTLYAHWEKEVYVLTFDTPDCDVVVGNYIEQTDTTNYTKFTVDVGVTNLPKPEMYGYEFLGWSDDNGFIVSKIAPGTVGPITLHANWTSTRNKAVSYSEYGSPIIIEDAEAGQFIFIYNIGRIERVPLDTLKYIGQSEGIVDKYTVTISDTISESEVQNVNTMISEATTMSSGWTLANEWEDIYSSTEDLGGLKEMSDERTNSTGTVVGGKYFVSNSDSGSTYVNTESGSTSSTSAKITTENSVGINSSYDESSKTYSEAELGVKNETELSAGVKVGAYSAGVKNTTTVNANVTSGREDNTAFHIDGSYSGYVGTVDTSDSSQYVKSTVSDTSSWNSTTGYEKSGELTENESLTSAIKEQIYQNTTHSLSKALSGTNSETTEKSDTSTSSREYSTSLTYGKISTETTETTVERKASASGYYRIASFGTVHVYGIVGYDIATSSYYSYCYNVLDDKVTADLDFSKNTNQFDDCQNGVVTFEIPYEVNEYILGATGKTNGLDISEEGEVTGFTPDADFDGTVIVPQYEGKYDGYSEYYSVEITSIDANTFAKSKEQIKVVILPKYITEIPAGLFDGCTNLETVIAFGVSSIGDGAFKDCVNLKKFYVDTAITHLGEKAFENVPEVAVMAYNSEVAKAGIECGAKNITVDISKLSDTFENREIKVTNSTETFALIGGGKTYNNVSIDSDATVETAISNMKFSGNNTTPITINSPTVTLARVTVEDSPSFALVLTAENTDLRIYGTNILNSTIDNTVLSKNVTISRTQTGTTSRIVLNGKYLVCGAVVNEADYLNVTSEKITADEFNSYLTPLTVTFDANDGTVGTATKTVYKGQKYGELPIPERLNYGFTGWYTATENGQLITADTVVELTEDTVLYAMWEADLCTIYFDANGGSVSPASKTVKYNSALGELPVPTREYYTFDGWFYTADGEDTQPVEEGYIWTSDSTALTLYARWTKNTINLIFEPLGGTTPLASMQIKVGEPVGTLPTPTRDYYTFGVWYTGTGMSVYESTVFTDTTDVVLYAQWLQNPVSDWVDSSSVPDDAQIIDRRTIYRYRDRTKETTQSTSSSLDGWTQYGSPVYGNWSAWGYWQPGSITEDIYTDVETATVYGYYYYRCSNCGAHMYSYSTCYTWLGGCGRSGTMNAYDSWYELYVTTPWSSASDPHGTGKPYIDDPTYGRIYRYTDAGSITGYRKRTRTVHYNFYRWTDYGAWSAWSTTVYYESESRQIGIANQYRYRAK